jgi:plasmid stability protein
MTNTGPGEAVVGIDHDCEPVISCCYHSGLEGAMADLLIRNIEAQTHDELKRRAAAQGLSVQQYVARVLTAHTSRPSIQEWLRRLDELVPVDTDMSGADAVAAARADAL